jgi:hypothetical protein
MIIITEMGTARAECEDTGGAFQHVSNAHQTVFPHIEARLETVAESELMRAVARRRGEVSGSAVVWLSGA